jgi:cytoskeletal protein CcmA (bactofilin family)
MTMSARVGQTIHIKGDLTASDPFLVTGHIDGTIDVNGHTLTIAESAAVAATVTADTVIVQGYVKGEMAAANKIVVRETASVDGELSAPVVTIAEGAILHGLIDTTRRKAK